MQATLVPPEAKVDVAAAVDVAVEEGVMAAAEDVIIH